MTQGSSFPHSTWKAEAAEEVNGPIGTGPVRTDVQIDCQNGCRLPLLCMPRLACSRNTKSGRRDEPLSLIPSSAAAS